MKELNLPKKHKNTYLYYFLPLIESMLTLKKFNKQDLVLNGINLSEYFQIRRTTIRDMIAQAENDGLIEFDKKTTIIDGIKYPWAMNVYKLPEDEEYYSKLQKYINDYMLWLPSYGDRLDLFLNYVHTIENKKEEVKNLSKELKNKYYCEKYEWAIKLLKEINNSRPVQFRSNYLAEGKNRENNMLCYTLNPEKEHDRYIPEDQLLYRNVLLTEYFETDKFEEFDTNGSIYRLSYAIHNRKVLSHDVDVYQEIWNITGFKKLDKHGRDCLKIICMPIFMSNGAKNGWNSLLMTKENLSNGECVMKAAITYLCNISKTSARKLLDTVTEAMKIFLNTDCFLEAEIFIHESNLHLLMLKDCLDNDIKVINVYDGFYFIKGSMTQKKYDKLYDKATRTLISLLNC